MRLSNLFTSKCKEEKEHSFAWKDDYFNIMIAYDNDTSDRTSFVRH